MNIPQEKFQKFIELLSRESDSNDLIVECLNHKDADLSFSFFDDSDRPNKMSILKTYITRGKLEERRFENPFVLGYDKLLPALTETEIEKINISSITTEVGTYIVFSDLNYDEFIGILKSKSTLSEVRERMKDSIYYQELTFLKGKYQESLKS